MTRGSRFTRGLALVLCLCLTAPYLPVPGHAEGCGHVHGEECYQEVTQCVHTHGEDCWSDPEAKDAGEEPDACAHVCNEDTGCVTKELNCPHVHDDTCGEQLQKEPEPEPEEPEPEEPQPEEPAKDLVISGWEWIDEEEALDPETGALCLSSDTPVLLEEIVELLPKAILATLGEEPQTVPLAGWHARDYPQETGANSGSYLLEAALPEGYTLAQTAAALTVRLEFAQAQLLAECSHEHVDMDTGLCKACNAQVYVAKIGDTGYATLGEAFAEAQKSENRGCTVTMLCDVKEVSVSHTIFDGRFTLDLNGKEWTTGSPITIAGGDLTLTTSSPDGKIAGVGGSIILRTGKLTVDSGEYGFPKSVRAISVRDGSLVISGGKFTGGWNSLVIDGYSNIELTGGFFFGKDVNSIAVRNRSAAELLSPGCAFYSDAEGSNIIDASGDRLLGTVYILRNHPVHVFDRATCKCVCGLYRHPSVNMATGICGACQMQVYAAKIGDTGYKTLEDALKAAEKMEGCTVTMLSDMAGGMMYSFSIDHPNVTLDLNGKKIEASGVEITVAGGVLKIDDSSKGKNGEVYADGWKLFQTTQGGEVRIYGGRLSNIMLENGEKVTFYGGILTDVCLNSKLLDSLAPGYAAYSDANGETVVDASTLVDRIGGTYYILPHMDIYDPTIDKCPCGRKLLQATMEPPAAVQQLTYTGSDQALVKAGSATGGKLVYSLEENGTYAETVPQGKKADTYTVWYYVQGDAGQYYNTAKQSLTVTIGKKTLTPVVTIPARDFDGTKAVPAAAVTLDGKVEGDDLTYTLGTLEYDFALPGTRTASLTGPCKLTGLDADNYDLKSPTGLTGVIQPTSRYLDADSLPNADTVTIDGEEYPVVTENGKRYVTLPETGSLLTVYNFVTGSDAHHSYPEGMRVFAIDRQGSGSSLAEIGEMEDLLLYEGCSIRLNGSKGIRLITSIDQTKKKALVGSNLAGFTLVEYGTLISRESALKGKTLNLQNVNENNYNFAYSRSEKKDPVFKTENGRVQYTNVLVNFQPGDYDTELVLRPYIKLLDADGDPVTLYGGTVTRTIRYIAQQNIDTYKPGTAGYRYLQEILNG